MVAGVDLNQRPLGYEPTKSMARLCLSMIYIEVVLRFFTVFRGNLFSICSQFVLELFSNSSLVFHQADRMLHFLHTLHPDHQLTVYQREVSHLMWSRPPCVL